VEKTATQFGLTFLGGIELDPEIRKGGDTGRPVALEGEESPRAQSLYQFARKVKSALDEQNARPSDSVIEIR
jgi:ATP-binding protein involved in chromosome partitioning